MAIWEACLVLVTGLFCGVINTLAGGGSLLSLPLLIFLGLPGPIANGTNRVAIWIQCIASVAGFRQSGLANHKLAFLLAIPATIGAIVGAQIAVDISDDLFNKILAVIMLVMAVMIVWNPKPTGTNTAPPGGLRLVLVTVVMFLIGVYGGFIQAGVGYFFIATLTLLCGYDLVLTTSLKVYIIAIYMTFAMAIFIWNGQVHWPYALVLSVGNGAGGWLGSKIAVKKGDEWIRIVLVITVVFMALKLMGWLPI